jgi:pimeloyl-ACP methyl ester carboxylesterase
LKITTDDGVELAVEVAGSGPGLLLVHGHGGAKEDFADHVERLARRHTVVVFDHRGHGASGHPPSAESYSLARLRADTWAVADAVGLDRFRVLGHSMGGMVVRRMPLEHPERVEALVLMDTSAARIPVLVPELVEAAAEIGFTQGKDVLHEMLVAAGTLDTPAYKRMLADRPGYAEFDARKWADTSIVAWGTLAVEIANQDDDLSRLRGVSCPTLVIVGAQDDAFLDASRSMAATIPGAQLAMLPNAGHSPQFEAPDAWAAALDGFLAGLPAPVA